MPLVTERWAARKLTKSSGGWQHVRIFDVTDVGDLDAAISAVESHDASTQHNAESPLSSVLYVANRDGEETGFRFWTVVVTYATSPEGRHTDPGNMLDEPIKWQVVHGCEQYNSPVDADGHPVLNSSMQAFSSDPPGFINYITLIGQRVEPFFDLAKSLAFQNSINMTDLTFDNNWTIEKGQACCRYMKLISTVSGSEKYVITEYAIELRQGTMKDDDGYWDGFKVRILNDGTDGYYDSSGNTGALCRLRKDPNTGIDTPDKVSYPVRLDEGGRPLGSGFYVLCPTSVDSNGYIAPVYNQAPVTNAGTFEWTDDAVFIKFFPHGYAFKNLADLGL